MNPAQIRQEWHQVLDRARNRNSALDHALHRYGQRRVTLATQVDRMVERIMARTLPAPWSHKALPASVVAVLATLQREASYVPTHQLVVPVGRAFEAAGARWHPLTTGGYGMRVLTLDGVLVCLELSRKGLHMGYLLQPFADLLAPRGRLYVAYGKPGTRENQALLLALQAYEKAQGSLGAFYQALGSSGFCGICGRTLRDPLSKDRGIGPECLETHYQGDVRRIHKNPAISVDEVIASPDLTITLRVTPSKMDFITLTVLKNGWRKGSLQAWRDPSEPYFRVHCVSADHGYGPLLYDLLLEVALERGAQGVTPDRMEVSNQAQAVWSHYATRRPDARSGPLPAGFPLHGIDVLDRWYQIQNAGRLQRLDAAHKLIRE